MKTPSFPQPLQGIRVLDLSRVLAGPFATQQLADLGAKIIKIEQPGIGDPTRAWGPPFTKDGRSAYFLFCNRGKKSLTMDLNEPRVQKTLYKMALESDVLIESFRPGHLNSLGLNLEKLRRANPRLVTCSISAFGPTGPRKNEGGYDALIQAMSGLMSITGPEKGPPNKIGVAVIDLAAGLFASNAIVAALLGRGLQKGKGPRHIDIALYDCALVLLANVASSSLLTGQDAKRYGNAHATVVPYQPFAAKDGEFLLAVGSDGQWKILAETLGRKDWLAKKAWLKNEGRVRDRKRLIAALSQEFKKHKRAALVKKLLKQGIPVGEIRTVKGALSDPIVKARNLITTHSDGTRTVSTPMRYYDRVPKPLSPPPRLK